MLSIIPSIGGNPPILFSFPETNLNLIGFHKEKQKMEEHSSKF